MKLLHVLTANYYINVAAIAWVSAQVMKVLLTLITTDRVEMERFIGSGGMPSSHSAFTVAIAVAMARKLGYDSPEFALAFAFAAVVMYDAMGVRRAAGEQAKVLNRMMEFSDFPWFLSKEKSPTVVALGEETGDGEQEVLPTSAENEMKFAEKELKEYIGHTPLEVVGGCLLGIIVALLVPR